MLPTATILVTTSFAVLTLNSAIINAEDCNHLGTHFYDRLNCTPKYTKHSKCPFAYSCPKYNVSTEYCLFNNKQYTFGEEILGTHYCNVACYCDRDKGGQNPITCAAVDCPWYTPNEKECYLADVLAGCCPVKEICEPFDDIPKCELNGKTYMEGQIMETGNCWTCVCKEGFKGVMEEPYCIKMPCDLEIYNAVDIANKCAPIYLSIINENEPLCCPFTFLCPDEIKEELKVTKHESCSPRKEKCLFKDQKFNVGDTFEAKYSQGNEIKYINCTCLLPPQVACFERNLILWN